MIPSFEARRPVAIRPLLLLVVAGWLASLPLSEAWAAQVGTAFTYQGRLVENGAPAAGHYDLQIALFATDTEGNPCGVALTNTVSPARGRLPPSSAPASTR